MLLLLKKYDAKMSDITMCQAEDCPLQEYCYRYQATPNRAWQSYAKFGYKLTVMGAECEHFYQISDVQK